MDNKLIGENFKAMRELAGFTQTAAAAELGITQPQLSQIEHGSGGVTIKTLIRASVCYKCDLDSLLLRKPTKS